MSLALPDFAELVAPPEWRRIDFISDLHLAAETPATLAALEAHLQETAADAVILLGDIFEVWIGDDARTEPFEARCLEMLRKASERLALFFMVGNRDFIAGEAMAAAGGMKRLADPTVLVAFGQRWLLTHGDALCLEDKPYQAFRAQVRNPAWQQAWLGRPLAERAALARQMRAASQARQAEAAAKAAAGSAQESRMGDGELWADLDREASIAWLQAARATDMIHGHTHRPATHELAPGLRRHVLSDWDLDGASPPRAEVLRLRQAGLRRIALA
ncbi:MAG: UDP-2,3-diacylglucosamine diphosphatase [Paucibacter sp.]|nr:UDP-2,3-diacylglucosamine diphosphatase [Roseateles sp.]